MEKSAEEMKALDETIERFEKAAENNTMEYTQHGRPGADKRAEEYAQYAKWLKELKRRKIDDMSVVE